MIHLHCLGFLTVLISAILMDHESIIQWTCLSMKFVSVWITTCRYLKLGPCHDREIQVLISNLDTMYLPVWGINILFPFLHTENEVMIAMQLYFTACLCNIACVAFESKNSLFVITLYFGACLSWVAVNSAFSYGWFISTLLLIYVNLDITRHTQKHKNVTEYYICLYISDILLQII